MEEEEEDRVEEKREKTAAEMRKINKPLMERKRRERINNCLNQLKLFLMEATKKDSSYYSKLEKADILEMTVKYLKNLQRQQVPVTMTTDPKVVSKYSAGFTQCASEVARFLSKVEGFQPDMRNRLVNHLTNYAQKIDSHLPDHVNPSGMHAQPIGIQQLATSTSSLPSTTIHQAFPVDVPLSGSSGSVFVSNSPPPPSGTPGVTSSSGSAASSASPVPGTVQNVPVLPVQLIPAKLPGGEFVLLMANTQSVPAVTTNLMNPLTLQLPSQVTSVTSSSSLQGSSTPIVTHPTPSSPATAHSNNVNLGSSAIAVVPPQVQEPRVDLTMTKPINLSMQPKTEDIGISKPCLQEPEPKPGPSNLSDVSCSRTPYFLLPGGKGHSSYPGLKNRASPPHTISRPPDVDSGPHGLHDFQPRRVCGHSHGLGQGLGHGQGHGHGHGQVQGQNNGNVVHQNVDHENMWRPW